MEALNPGGPVGPDGQKQPQSFVAQLQTTMASMTRFMKALGQ